MYKKILLGFVLMMFVGLASAETFSDGSQVQPMDYWTLFVHYVFGGFWFAVIGLALAMFIIMGILGRISIYSVSWYLVMFVLAMALGYGYTTINVLVTFSLIVAAYLSIKSYIDSR